jgi:preprotein translocase subunit YajC
LLDFLVSPAYAQQAGGEPSAFIQFLPLILLLVLFYFMLIRPQMKRSREHKDMVSKLAKGDEVISSGGLAGVVRDISDVFVTVEIADNVQVRVQKVAIVSVLPKGTLKSQ